MKKLLEVDNFNHDPIYNLVAAILRQAADDYLHARPAFAEDARVFFEGKWFSTMCPQLNQEVVVRKLREIKYGKR